MACWASLALIPASDLAVALVNRFVTTVVAPDLLPRLEWAAGVPAEFRTMVAVPTLFGGRADVEAQVERLEVHYLANADGDVRFALVSDWPDAPAEHVPGDEEILAAARDGIARLNARHGPAPDGGARFFVFHRRRAVELERRRVDGLGAQARQAPRVEPPAAGRHGHDVPGRRRTGARPGCATC